MSFSRNNDVIEWTTNMLALIESID